MTQGNQGCFDKDKFKKLLDEAKNIPKRRDTFLSITNYAHHENMISDILKFFFEDNQHGMKNLWIRALLECVKDFGVDCFKNSNVDFSNERIISVEREYVTDNDKRIDLLIDGDTYIISLENKIRAPLSNDLVEYAETIHKVNEAVYGGVKTEINMVLSVRSVKHADAYKTALGNKTKVSNLCNVTYDKLLEKVKNLLPYYLKSMDNIWLIYLNDFIYTMEGEIGYMDMDFAKFVSENRDGIEEILNRIDKYQEKLKEEVEKLETEVKKTLISSQSDGQKGNQESITTKLKDHGCEIKKSYVFSGEKAKADGQRSFASCVIDVVGSQAGKIIAVETYLDYNEWHIVLWARKGTIDIAGELNKLGVDIFANSYASKLWTGSCEVAKVNIDEGVQSVADKIINTGITNAYKILSDGATPQTTQTGQQP